MALLQRCRMLFQSSFLIVHKTTLPWYIRHGTFSNISNNSSPYMMFQNGLHTMYSRINLLNNSLCCQNKRNTLKVGLTSNNNLIAIQAKRFLPTLNQIRRQKPRTKKKRSKNQLARNRRILLGPQRKAVCVKCVVRTPRKPNSAQRKCAVLRLNDGRLITAYMPREKPNLQEHGVVLFRGGRVQDCPGIKYKIIRGKFDMN